MSFKRRLFNLECRPFYRPIPPRATSPGMIAAMRKLCLPLPAGHTQEELKKVCGLFAAAQKMPRENQTGWQAVRRYALNLHREYDGEFADDDDEWEPLT